MLVQVLPEVRDIRRFGAASLDLCLVASGRLDAYYEKGLSRWDYAAGALCRSRVRCSARRPGWRSAVE